MSYSTQAAGASEYRAVAMQHDVSTASPHRLIQLLMERFLTKIALARKIMESGGVVGKGEAVSHAISIVECLRASLNHEPNAELSSNFDALYDYMARRLVESNLRNDVALLDEVSGLMGEIKSAWDVIGDQVDHDSPVGV